MIIFLGILFIGLGIAMLAFRDFMWELTRMSNEFKGVNSERTDLWEMGNAIGGVILIGVGVATICLGSSFEQEANNTQRSIETVNTMSTSMAQDQQEQATRYAEIIMQALTPSATPRPDETGRVTRVIDGDTIEVSVNDRLYLVRYLGINAPSVETECGEQAAAANTDLVEGETVSLYRDITDQDLDERLLRYVYVGDTFINAELVRLGVANAVKVPPDEQHADELSLLAQDAQREEQGCVHDS